MKRPNGYGSVIKLQGNRRKPFACRKTIGFNEKGYPIYKYISYHKTRREADNALREYNADPYNLNKILFSQAFEKWMTYKGYDGAVEKKYKNAFRHCEPLHNDYMTELTLPRLQGFFDELITTESNIHTIKTMLSNIIDYCVKRGALPLSMRSNIDLIDTVARQDTRKVERKVFTKEEIDNLWMRKDEPTPRLILFYIYTGMRFSELAKLPPDQLTEDRIIIKKTKTEAGIREIPLSDKAKSLLPLPTIPAQRTWNKYLKEFNHTPHDTRHTFISLLTESGVDSRIIKKLAGHAPTDVTDIYTHISFETMLEAVNKI